MKSSYIKANLYLRLLITVSSVLFITACGKRSKDPKNPPLPDVQVITVGLESVPVYSEYTGQVFGDADVKIQPRVQGLITGQYFKEGGKVSKGDLLYTIDDRSLRLQVDGYKADLARTQTILTNKKSDLERIKPLAEMKALSAHDLDAAIADYEAAKNEVQISEARLADMKIQLDYTRITAPVSGIIGISNLGVGDYVGGPGVDGLNTISATTGIQVRFSISENDYLHFLMRAKKDSAYATQLASLPVDLLLGDGSVYPEKGKLLLADRQVDPSTGSIIIEAAFSNGGQILRPGQYVKVRFRTQMLENAIVVPQQAVNQMQDIFQVHVLNDSNKVVPRVVKTGLRVGNNWVITDGIKPGEKLALIGNAFLNPKIPVHPVIINWSKDSSGSN